VLSRTELADWFSAPLEVVPAVDVLGAEAVRLHRGEYGQVVERPGSPLELALHFAAAGARRIHFVDLDGARSGEVRPELVASLAAAVAPVPVQASGGIRTLADAEALLQAGADRVVVGTAAFPAPAPWSEAFGDALVVALDLRDGVVRHSGWTRASGLALDEALSLCLEAGVQRVLCTAIERDGTLAGPDLELVQRVAASGLGVLAAGGIRSRADVEALARAGAAAAIVGRALLAAPGGADG